MSPHSVCLSYVLKIHELRCLAHLLQAKETQAVKEGKKRFFLKKSEKKKQELIQKYQELKSTGRLQKAIEKKRKKNAQKDRRYMPSAL